MDVPCIPRSAAAIARWASGHDAQPQRSRRSGRRRLALYSVRPARPSRRGGARRTCRAPARSAPGRRTLRSFPGPCWSASAAGSRARRTPSGGSSTAPRRSTGSAPRPTTTRRRHSARTAPWSCARTSTGWPTSRPITIASSSSTPTGAIETGADNVVRMRPGALRPPQRVGLQWKRSPDAGGDPPRHAVRARRAAGLEGHRLLRGRGLQGAGAEARPRPAADRLPGLARAAAGCIAGRGRRGAASRR